MARLTDKERCAKLVLTFGRPDLWYILKKLAGDKLAFMSYRCLTSAYIAELIVQHVRDYVWKLSSLDHALIREIASAEEVVTCIMDGNDAKNPF